MKKFLFLLIAGFCTVQLSGQTINFSVQPLSGESELSAASQEMLQNKLRQIITRNSAGAANDYNVFVIEPVITVLDKQSTSGLMRNTTLVKGELTLVAKVPFDELKNLAKADLDFHTLQALFMNEIFLPGKKVLTVRDISSFAVRPENENALIEVKNGKHFAYRFRTNTNDGLLKESHIGLSGTQYGINWRYDKFRPLEQRQFPGTMTVSFEGAAKPVTAVFELSRLSTNKDWEAHTEVPGKYERIELQDLLKQLIK